MEVSEEFCLRWNNHQQNLRTTMADQYKNQIFTDVTLGVEDGHSIQCHKMILAASSRYFQSILIDFPYEHPIVVLNDVKYKEIMAILEYMYKGEVNVPGNELAALFKVAEALEIKGLVGENKESPQSEVGNRSVVNTSQFCESVKTDKERASPPSSASSPNNRLSGKSRVMNEHERARYSPCASSAFYQGLVPEGHNSPIADTAVLQSSLSARYSPLLGSHGDNGTELFPRRRRRRKISSNSVTSNRATPILRTALDQGQVGGSRQVPLVRHESHYRTANNGATSNDEAIDSHPTRSLNESETWTVQEDDNRVSRLSSSEETSAGNANCASASKPGTAKRYKQYTHTDIAGAIAAVLENGMSANKAAVMFRVPSRTLYDKISRVKKEEEMRNGTGAGLPKRKRNASSSGACFPYGILGATATGSIYANYSDTLPMMDDPASVLETTFAESRDNSSDRDAKFNVNLDIDGKSPSSSPSPSPRLPMPAQQASHGEESDNEAEDLSVSRKSDVGVIVPTRIVIREAI